MAGILGVVPFVAIMGAGAGVAGIAGGGLAVYLTTSKDKPSPPDHLQVSSSTSSSSRSFLSIFSKPSDTSPKSLRPSWLPVEGYNLGCGRCSGCWKVLFDKYFEG